MKFDQGDSRLPEVFPRLAERYPTPSLEATWFPPSRRKTLGGKAGAIKVRIVEMSMSGLMIEAPANKKLAIGRKLRLDFHGTEAIIEIENIRAHDHPDQKKIRVYGVSIFHPSDEFQSLIAESVHKLHKVARY